MAYRLATRNLAPTVRPASFLTPTALARKSFATSSTSCNADQPSEPAPSPEGGAGEKKKKGSILKSILHGSDQAKSEGDTMQSHSTTVGRQKYIHEIQTHKIHPQYSEEYKALIGEYFAKIQEHPEVGQRLRGSWEVIVGDLDTFAHIFEFEGYHGYDAATAKVRSHPEYKEYLNKIRPMLQSRTSQLNREFAFWPCAREKETGGIYEMRTYALKPGTLLEWEVEWRRGLEARRKFVEPIGAWFAQVGRLHVVRHMWQYGNLADRLEKREQAWTQDSWGKTVAKTVKLCDSMDANILSPLPFSPLR